MHHLTYTTHRNPDGSVTCAINSGDRLAAVVTFPSETDARLRMLHAGIDRELAPIV